MKKIQFGALPDLAQFGIGASLLFVWTSLETQVIEPLGIYHYMPFYRVARFCAWDLLVIVLITVTFVRLNKIAGIANP